MKIPNNQFLKEIFRIINKQVLLNKILHDFLFLDEIFKGGVNYPII